MVPSPEIIIDGEKQQEYWERLLDLAKQLSSLGHPIEFSEEDKQMASTRVWYDGEEFVGGPIELLIQHAHVTRDTSGLGKVCIVENIRPA